VPGYTWHATGDIGTLALVHLLHAAQLCAPQPIEYLSSNFRGVRQASLHKAEAAFD